MTRYHLGSGAARPSTYKRTRHQTAQPGSEVKAIDGLNAEQRALVEAARRERATGAISPVLFRRLQAAGLVGYV